MRTYLPEQLNCMEKLKKFKVGALFMQAGTGKTQAAVGIINSRTDIDKVLWFTPCRTKDNLKNELEKCFLNRNCPLYKQFPLKKITPFIYFFRFCLKGVIL